jgi:cysteine desulfurase
MSRAINLVEGMFVMLATGVAASAGSACHAGSHAASGVLGAMGASAERAAGAVRLSVRLSPPMRNREGNLR